MITAEIQANNIKVNDLAKERGLKTAQNVAAGVAGVKRRRALKQTTEPIKPSTEWMDDFSCPLGG
jgi:hypothetical protein